MTITATELKKNLGKYLSLAENEEVFVSKNGKIIAKISSPYVDKMALIDELTGILPKDATLEEGKEEMLKKYEIFNWFKCHIRYFN